MLMLLSGVPLLVLTSLVPWVEGLFAKVGSVWHAVICRADQQLFADRCLAVKVPQALDLGSIQSHHSRPSASTVAHSSWGITKT